MPRQTDRQQATQGLLQVYLTLLATESQALMDPGSDSDSDLDSQSSDDEIEQISTSSVILNSILSLHAYHYTSDWSPIPKSNANLQLLLNDWKINHPDIF
ncbi:hypothetical protein V8B97DRAFT_2008529 [Scleroderma yunnanense]